MVLLYRVLPWKPAAAAGEPGHPLYMPPFQTQSRLDNPGHYKVFYAADRAVGAVGEAFGGRLEWTDAMLESSRLPDARKALVEYAADVRVTDLDDGNALARREIRPSHVVSPDREATQAWALRIFREGDSDGVRWWSVYDSRWGVFGLWRIDAIEVRETSVLDRSHPVVWEAAAALKRPWVD